jgi:hypothetical protein
VHLLPEVIVGDAVLQGFVPPFKFKAKLLLSTKEMLDTFRVSVPVFLISIVKGDGEFPGVTGPKLYVDGKTFIEGLGPTGAWLDPPPPPHPENVMENSSDMITRDDNLLILIIFPPGMCKFSYLKRCKIHSKTQCAV